MRRVRHAGAWALVLSLAAIDAGAQDTVVVARDTIRARPDIRVCAGGDVTLGNNLDRRWAASAARQLASRWGRSAQPDSLLAPLMPLVADADIVLLNVESAIGSGPAPSKCGPKSTSCFAFRAPPEAAPALRRVAPQARVVGNIANNHARDAGTEGFEATRRALEDADVFVTGADTLATPVATTSGDTVAFLGFYTSVESPDVRDLAAVRRHVERARARWPLVVVTAHMGGEGAGAQRTSDRTEMFLRTIDRGNPVGFARTAIEAGAAVVFGHGPHVIRAASWHGDRLAFYSLGNLLTYGPFSNREPSRRGGIACVVLAGDGALREAALRSTEQLAPGVLVIDSTHRAAALMDSLGRLDFPRSGARVSRDGTIVMRARAIPAPLIHVDSVRKVPLPDSIPLADTAATSRSRPRRSP